jgi:murein DD-endopeptidase MepM/ murein hydrolase activator NlpD
MPLGFARLRSALSLGLAIISLYGLQAVVATSPASGKPNREPGAAAHDTKAKKREPVEKLEPAVKLGDRARRRVVTRSTLKGPWAYVLPVDYGVRADESGQGHFRAPRFHGEHNGIDLLAPLGTPVFAACSGLATAGRSASFGVWVRVICPVPNSLGQGNDKPYASIFYAHLRGTDIPLDTWSRVKKGRRMGQVGKTGNASGPRVQPHLHLELIIQSSQRAALKERHLGRDQSMVPAASRFFGALEELCLRPHGFHSFSGNIGRARRADPFLVLTCLSSDKPAYQVAPRMLDQASQPWSQLYSASAFNVDAGPRAFLLASR